MNIKLNIVFGSVLALALSGCTSTTMTKKLYEGTPLSADKISTFKVSEQASSCTSSIIAVDHKKTPRVMGIFSYPTEVQLLPGKHDVIFDVFISGISVDTHLSVPFSVVTQPGGVYMFKSQAYKPVTNTMGKIANMLFHDSDDSALKIWVESKFGEIINTTYYYDHRFSKNPPPADKFVLKES